MSDHTGMSNKLKSIDRDTFAQLLRAEFIRFRTVRSWMISLGAVVISLVLLPFAVALASHGSNLAISTGPDGEMVSDTYTFVHQPLVGDGTLTTRVTSLSGMYTPLSNSSGNGFGVSSTSQLGSQLRSGLAPWAKAGIILEPDTKQGTDYAAVMVTGSQGVQMQDNYTHDSPGLTGSVGPSSPRWLRITRAGDMIAGYDSTDGVHWSKMSTIRLAGLPHSVQIGLFVTSPVYFPAGSNNGTPSVATANFDRTSTQGDLPYSFWTGDTVAGFYPSLSSGLTWRQHSADAFTISGSGDIAPLVGNIVTTNWSGACIVDGIIVGLLFLIVFAASFAPSEYRRGASGIAGVCRRNHCYRARRRNHPPRPGCQWDQSLSAKRAGHGSGYLRHRTFSRACRGFGRCARQHVATQGRDECCRHRAFNSAGRDCHDPPS